jgi:hypothetical protein
VIEFREINDADPALAHSPMVRAIEMTFRYISENCAIGLTPAKAFKRTFVHWAAAEFAWPGFSKAELFSVNKVLNEIDFPPLMDMHDLLIALKIGRHYKRSFRLTKAGQSLGGRPGRLFGIVTPFYLFEVDHLRFSLFREEQLGNWDVFLNVLNVQTEDSISGRDLSRTLYGDPSTEGGFNYALSGLYSQILRPLCWTGLLHEQRPVGFRLEDSVFTKTPLWRAALRLDTDTDVTRAVRH